jgi:hypothetical protein
VLPVQHFCTLIRRAGRANRAAGKERVLQAKFEQDFSFKIHLFLQNVLQSYASNIYRHLFEKFRYPIRRCGRFHHRVAFIFPNPFGASWDFYMRTQF